MSQNETQPIIEFKTRTSVEGSDANQRITGSYANDALYGRCGDDILIGLGGRDLLDGGTGNDELYGGDGDDVLNGGAGSNQLSGDAGADGFMLNQTVKKQVLDTVTDFSFDEGDSILIKTPEAIANPSLDALNIELVEVDGSVGFEVAGQLNMVVSGISLNDVQEIGVEYFVEFI